MSVITLALPLSTTAPAVSITTSMLSSKHKQSAYGMPHQGQALRKGRRVGVPLVLLQWLASDSHLTFSTIPLLNPWLLTPMLLAESTKWRWPPPRFETMLFGMYSNKRL